MDQEAVIRLAVSTARYLWPPVSCMSSLSFFMKPRIRQILRNHAVGIEERAFTAIALRITRAYASGFE